MWADPHPPCGALWVPALRQASAQAQQNKILISGAIGAFRSGKRGAAGCESCPRYWATLCSWYPTENTVSVDTVLTFTGLQTHCQAAGIVAPPRRRCRYCPNSNACQALRSIEALITDSEAQRSLKATPNCPLAGTFCRFGARGMAAKPRSQTSRLLRPSPPRS